jgi:F-type H+-transporting ATPase subunit a
MAHAAPHIPDPIDHVVDAEEWHLFDRLFGTSPEDAVHLHLPHFNIFGHEFQVTKYMILELLAALLIICIFLPIARKIKTGAMPKGAWWNWFEGMLTFIRDEVARPNLGAHHADKFVPFLWTIFLFILFCNLLGMFPWMGSPTASVVVTGALALISLILMFLVPIAMYGPGKFLKSMWIDTGLPIYAALPIAGMIFAIEFMGNFIKSFVLAVRLFANMFAGHMVLATILTFIVIVGNNGYTHLWPVVTFFSVVGVVALSLLELFVAFLQAYVFVFLTSLFVGMSLHHIEEHEGHGHEAHASHAGGHH